MTHPTQIFFHKELTPIKEKSLLEGDIKYQPTSAHDKIRLMMKLLKSKGHICFFDESLSCHPREEELTTDYYIRVCDGLEPFTHKTSCIEGVTAFLTDFIKERGYDYV
jgi:hypothetical protein